MANFDKITIERTGTFNAINGFGKFLGFFGINLFKLKADKLLANAHKQTGYNYQSAELKEGLEKLIQSVEQEANANTFGNLAMKQLAQRNLVGRFQVEQHISKHPQILEEEIKEPLFIIGMPRTGTTILHALLHNDPENRSPLAWECLLPYPVPKPETYGNNEQVNTVKKEFGQLFKLVPDFLKKHHMAADSPQECIGVTALDFNSFQFTAQMYLPSYLHWMQNGADIVSTMRFHKRFLQYLQSGGVRGTRWLLKTPVHMSRLEELFEVYPDAKVIMTHRHPSKVVPSAASLISSVRSLYSDTEDTKRSGQEQLEVWGEYINKFLVDRKKLNREDQFIDIKFEDFVSNQLEVVKQIYTNFGWTLTDVAEKKMQQFLDDNPKDKHGKHRYSLEQFDLTEQDIETYYADYIKFIQTL